MFLFRRHEYEKPYNSIEKCKERIESIKEGDINRCRYEIRMVGDDKFQIFRCHMCPTTFSSSTFNFKTTDQCISRADELSYLGGEFYIEF